MDPSRTDLAGLTAPDEAARAAALGALSRRDLQDPDVLGAVVALTRDERPAPDAFQPAAPPDPFGSFFGEATARRTASIGDLAAEALTSHGIAGDHETLDVLAAALAHDPPERLVGAAAALIGRTPWGDPVAAVRALVPAILRADHSMYEALPGLDEASLRAVVHVALRPVHPRALNEALNHPTAGKTCAAAIREAIVAGLELTEREAMEILALLVAWAGPEALVAARHLEPRWGWTVAFSAFEDPSALEPLRALLAEPSDQAGALGEVIVRAACSRRPVEGFPLPELLAWCDGDCRAVTTWKATRECADVLRSWVERWGRGEGSSDRAWEAIALLVDAGLHGPVVSVIAAALRDEDPDRALPDDPGLFKLLGRADPPVPGVVAALLARTLSAPDRARDAVHAITFAATDGDLPEIRGFVEAFLTRAEEAPERRAPPRRGVIKVVREGVDTAAVEPMVERIGDAELSARFAAVLPRFEHV